MGSHINDPVTDAQRRVAEDVRKCLKRSPPRDFLYPAEEARQKKYTVSSWGLSKLINTSHRRKEKKKGGGRVIDTYVWWHLDFFGHRSAGAR